MLVLVMDKLRVLRRQAAVRMEVEERKGERVLIDRTTLREKLMEWSARCHAVGRCFREARDRLEDGGLPCVIWAERGAEGLRLLYQVAETFRCYVG